MRIATAQIPIQSSTKVNSSQVKSLIIDAAKNGADFIHVPECSLSGYVKTQITI